MKRGTYGVCEQTRKPIPATRLMAVPHTRYSLEGQREMERNRRLTRRGVTALGNPITEMGDSLGFGIPTNTGSEEPETP
ncbi:MAG: TraR/DksA C4-type zinc finger protein [Puniceicoccales bacterium]|nr:TraR/DksA C4-type zinc finger protein [Puniceicoccales bacterium]